MAILNKPPDISEDFFSLGNIYYLAEKLSDYSPENGKGSIIYNRYSYSGLLSFNSMDMKLEECGPNEFPPDEYPVSPKLPFSVEFITQRTIRIRVSSAINSRMGKNGAADNIMLVKEKLPASDAWQYSKTEEGHLYKSNHASLLIQEDPWKVILMDTRGKVLTSTNHHSDNSSTFTPVMPFAWVRRTSDYSRRFSASFNLHPDERIFGFGEQYTEFNKRGRKINLFTDDARGSQNEKSHKPVPFFMSSRGYGVFFHTPAPLTCDVGKYYSGVNSVFSGDDELDMFIFAGDPKEVLDEYTELTGKAQLPPLWSFGFWMSRITYLTENEGREVAKKLRENKIPADVIHFDSGWFETDIICDYEFSKTRFDDPEKMISDLKDEGLRVSLWQLPYFVPRNKLFSEIVEKGLCIKDGKGNLPYDDAILDFTNPAAISWLREKLRPLLKMGVSAFKADFGEAAPITGIYHNGRSGFYEHNLYTTRYNKAIADITKEFTGENIIWARSGWAGSQRYPVHWGGDACTSDSGMAGTLRGGLSIGLSGFSFWSHDIGGFVEKTPESLYRRWMAFGVLTSHTRSHGQPPKEPWGYSSEFMDDFRLALNMRYRLMPYIYSQAAHCCSKGLPMLRAIFVEYPGDPGAWTLDDQYLFGMDILVAPLFEEVNKRNVYLPGGHKWTDYQSGNIYSPGWHNIECGKLPVIIMVREGAAIPHTALSQSTAGIDWSEIDLKVFPDKRGNAECMLMLPSDKILREVNVVNTTDGLKVDNNPFLPDVTFKISGYHE